MSTTLATVLFDQFVTLKEAAEALGITRVTLWRWIKDGKVESHRIGREVLIEKSEVKRLRR